MRPDEIDLAGSNTAHCGPIEQAAGAAVRAARASSAIAPGPKRRLAFAPELLLVGASTGGPQALIALITGLAPHVNRIPVCVTLHMPADLMPVIAAHVARVCRIETCVVTHRHALQAGIVHFSPGDRYLAIERLDHGFAITAATATSHDPYVPTVDMMFLSGAKSHGPCALGIVLSGMGKDGLAGSRAIVAAGGVVLAQDKASSAVWGMPGAIAKADLASAVLAPAALARDVVARLRPLVSA